MQDETSQNHVETIGAISICPDEHGMFEAHRMVDVPTGMSKMTQDECEAISKESTLACRHFGVKLRYGSVSSCDSSHSYSPWHWKLFVTDLTEEQARSQAIIDRLDRSHDAVRELLQKRAADASPSRRQEIKG